MEGELDPAAWDDIDPEVRRTALGMVRTIRPRLAPRLAAFADQDLAVSGCVLVAGQPARNRGADHESMSGNSKEKGLNGIMEPLSE